MKEFNKEKEPLPAGTGKARENFNATEAFNREIKQDLSMFILTENNTGRNKFINEFIRRPGFIRRLGMAAFYIENKLMNF